MGSIDWSLAGAVILSGLVLVFLVLVMLIAVVTLTGKLSGTGTAKPKAAAAPAPAPAAPAPAASAAPVPAPAAVDNNAEIAVISAAVAAIMEEESPGAAYAITNIQRTQVARPLWGFVGMQQNTRPF